MSQSVYIYIYIMHREGHGRKKKKKTYEKLSSSTDFDIMVDLILRSKAER